MGPWPTHLNSPEEFVDMHVPRPISDSMTQNGEEGGPGTQTLTSPSDDCFIH